jgi:hypothetical protein
MLESDRGAVLALARLEDDAAELRAAVDRLGVVLEEPIVTPRGDIAGTRVCVNPAVAALARLSTPLRDLRGLLGMTPMSRARLGIGLLELQEAGDRAAKASRMRSYMVDAMAYVERSA